MNDFNQEQYERHAEQYIASNANGDIGGGTPQERVALLKQYLSAGRKIFEIGSGAGEDAIELKKNGYEVLASEYVENFVKILKEKGLQTIVFDAKYDNVPEKIDAIYANAVFVHFSPEELTTFLQRAKEQLRNEKIIFLTVIKGTGYERSARNRGFERDFYYYSSETLKILLKQEGFTMLHCDDTDAKWIQIIATCR